MRRIEIILHTWPIKPKYAMSMVVHCNKDDVFAKFEPRLIADIFFMSDVKVIIE